MIRIYELLSLCSELDDVKIMLKCVKMMLTTCWPKRMTANTSPKRKIDIQLKTNSLNVVAILISLEKKLEMIYRIFTTYINIMRLPQKKMTTT